MRDEQSAQPAELADAVLISIRTRFVESILAGTKTFELRKKIPRAPVGRVLVVYSSGEDRAITAYGKVSGVTSGTPAAVWNKHKKHLGVSREEFEAYFEGSSTAYALHLEDIAPIPRRLTLKELRTEHGLEPPQSWRYLSQKLCRQLLEALEPSDKSSVGVIRDLALRPHMGP
ncbi:ASCH domain-containing protein [Arthrobacter sp. NPDC092385]|uniref:ASCH domain-containing protein n=1 Tax=Arthrobacter sp. NPDC092385 TaxID=3363943 RepID=UPI003827A78B